jgi:phosphoribosylformylglycinamidine synthase
MVIKVETHNHPTAIAPFAGAATGAGGEIRDEGATGIGGKPKAGLVGFSVSNLHIPALPQPWEQTVGYPSHIATSLDIMLQGPIGAASFNNEFGRPSILGYFRVFESAPSAPLDEWNSALSTEHHVNVWGYHKPIMIAGGLGQIRPMAVAKNRLPEGAKLIVLGGPALLIGLGGGAASSLYSGSGSEELDFASVQRSNPEIQRRCQEVINHCWSRGSENPIISIHDVGAGGLSNALSELVNDSDRGGYFKLRSISTADPSLSAMEIWCNEAQERYVLAIQEQHLSLFTEIAQRERCPFAVVGEVTHEQLLELYDEQFNESPVKLPLSVLFGEASKMHRQVNPLQPKQSSKINLNVSLSELIQRVLQHPTVADKSFLITIGDRTVTGLVARDQMVGPWQVPVSDVAVTASSYQGFTGEAMAMGERSPIALLNAAASARLSVAEAITNIAAADIEKLSDIKLSANWMAAVNYGDEALKLYEAVQAVAMELCPSLRICIPVGKDSLSMQMKWQEEGIHYNVASPVSLVISAFAPVRDIRKTLTPELNKQSETELLLIDLGRSTNRLGGSILAQVTQQLGDIPPDLDSPETLAQFFKAIQELRSKNLLLSYHDRSDGGLLATVCEMSFASHVGLTLDLSELGDDINAALFNEELGAVIQYSLTNKTPVFSLLQTYGLADCAHRIGYLNESDHLIISAKGKTLFEASRLHLHRLWSQPSYHLQALRDNPECAAQAYDALLDHGDPGLNASLNFEIPSSFPAIKTTKPKVAVLREQGVNGHV